MKIHQIKIKDLKFADYNPRKWSEKAIKELTKSLKRFGIVDPIIVNSADKRKNIIIGGHFRVKIAEEIGYKEVPVVYVDISDIKKEQELNLRLNKNTGQFDYDLLVEFGEDLLIDVGFEKEELDEIFDFDVEEDGFDAEKEYEKIKEPKSKYGDVYQLGSHRLVCGDATKSEDVEKLMDGELADMIFTDPPYNVGYYYTVTYVKGRVRKTKFHTFNDKKSFEDFIDFIYLSFNNGFKFVKEGAIFYCWHASKNEYLFRQGIEKAGWHISQTIYWLKNNATFNRGLDYLWIVEPCYFGWKKGKGHYKNKKITKGLQNIILLDKENFEELLDVMYEHKDRIIDYEHPTQKPIRLAERALKKHSKRDDIVIDLFGGSGSTLIGCEQLNRKCYMMEIDPKYCDVIVKRWERFINNKAKKL
ncbi:site-specific DNA-methyltransferase [Patescibacteria group bacterium AH-259-L07]|nr:site-specific DNA-methyltransferase [Patescibacteria group bacterium AH-259-L07]